MGFFSSKRKEKKVPNDESTEKPNLPRSISSSAILESKPANQIRPQYGLTRASKSEGSINLKMQAANNRFRSHTSEDTQEERFRPRPARRTSSNTRSIPKKVSFDLGEEGSQRGYGSSDSSPSPPGELIF
jgi:hypothetical protein